MATAIYTPTVRAFNPFPAIQPFAAVRAHINRRHIMSDEKLQALSNTPLFAGLDGKHMDLIGRVTDRVNVKAGTTLMFQDRVATHMSIIIDGTATVTIDGTVVATLGAGDIVGELSMVDDHPASATVTTNEACTLWYIGRSGFIPVWEQNPEMADAMLRAVVSKLRETNIAAYATQS